MLSFLRHIFLAARADRAVLSNDRASAANAASGGFSDVTRHDGGPRALFDHPVAAFVVLEKGPIVVPSSGDRVAKRCRAMRHARGGNALKTSLIRVQFETDGADIDDEAPNICRV